MFEYKVASITFGPTCEGSLNALGKDGWELVQIIENYFFFKRKVSPDV